MIDQERKNGTVRSRYEQLKLDREPYLERARECARFTLPYLVPPEWHTKDTEYPTPWQSVGAAGVINLAAKNLIALFPPNTAIFKYSLDASILDELQGKEQLRAEIEETLAQTERRVTFELESRAIRAPLHEALLQDVVAGNALLYVPAEGGMRTYPLSRYVVKRSPLGKVLEIIVMENVPYRALPEAVKKMLYPDGLPSADKALEDLEVYTYCDYRDKKCHVSQEINGKEVPGSKATYPEDCGPFIPIRWSCIDGEDYGRSFVEQWLGDFNSLENLSRAMAEGAAIAAKVVFMVNPNSTVKARDLAKVENGGFISGNANDVTTLQVQKSADLNVAEVRANKLEERLGKAFLMTSSIQRNGDRVTAYEWQVLVQELETTLGGVYSLLSQELQLPLVKRLLYILKKAGKVPEIPKEYAQPTIIAGMEALGRGNDLNKLRTFLGTLTETIGPEQVSKWVNVSDIISRTAVSIGIDTMGLIKTQEQVVEEEQQAQQMAMVQQAMGPGINQLGQMIQNAQKGGLTDGGEQNEQ